MAKKKSAKKRQANKSQAVRDYLATDPDAMPVTVSDKLKARGIDVEPRMVSQIKYQLKSAGVVQPAAAPSVEKRAEAREIPTAQKLEALSADDLVKVKELSEELGGKDKIAEALEILEKLR